MKLTKLERSWVLYDCGNSAYSIIVTTAMFPLFFDAIATGASPTEWLGVANSAGSLVIAILAPILGTFADYKDAKKRFFAAFFGLGVASVLAMFFLSQGQWVAAIVAYVASIIGFAGANLFYDAFLIDVTDDERMDQVSAAGFGWGYIASVIPFVVVIALVFLAQSSGTFSEVLAFRIGFALTAVWWAVFTIPFLMRAKQRFAQERSAHPVREGFVRLGRTLAQLKQHKAAFLFLVAYLFYIEGVSSIIRMATPIAVEMGFSSTFLIVVLLYIQIVAWPFALLFGRLAKRFGARTMIFVGICVYVVVVFLAFFIPSFESETTKNVLFWSLATLVASSQGGIQALSRSTFGKLIPKDKSAEFFGFYNISGKFSSFLGPLLIAGVTAWARRAGLADPSRFGVLSILLFFVIGGVLFLRTPTERASEHPA
ncbi:MAG: MFS transporter [Spirochaetales bacterium]